MTAGKEISLNFGRIAKRAISAFKTAAFDPPRRGGPPRGAGWDIVAEAHVPAERAEDAGRLEVGPYKGPQQPACNFAGETPALHIDW